MAAQVGRVLITLAGAAGGYEAYQQFSAFKAMSQPVQKDFIREVLHLPNSAKLALAATTVSALATLYLWKRQKPLQTCVEETVDLPIKVPAVVSESLRSGSELTTRAPPTCQGFVATREIDENGQEQLVVGGCCIRTDYGIWVPSHVLGPKPETQYLIGRRLMRTNKKGEMESYYPQVSLAEYYSTITDSNTFGNEMVSIPLSQAHMSQLGLTVAKMTNLPAKALATIVGPEGKSSMGLIQTGVIFGTLQYEGSTLSGFSGAPYIVSGKVVGIHLHGGHGGNGGQEVFYLNQLYKIDRGIVDESFAGDDSGAKVMEMAFKNNRSLQIERQGDLVVYRDDTGHYHRAKFSTYETLRGKYQYQSFDDREYAESDYSGFSGQYEDYAHGNIQEFDDYQKEQRNKKAKGYHSENRKYEPGKTPFLGVKKFPALKKLAQPVHTQPQKYRKSYQKQTFELLKTLSATLKNGGNPSQCSGPILVPQGPSTASNSNSAEGH